MGVPTLLTRAGAAAATLLGATLLASATDERTSPIDSGAVREVRLPPPAEARIEYFRLDAVDRQPAAEEEPRPPVGVVRWARIREPDELRVELEVVFFGAGTRVLHVERMKPDERKLVWREMRVSKGRTVTLEWTVGDPDVHSTEIAGGEVLRSELHPNDGGLFPLFLLEQIRSGSTFEGRFRLFDPLANAFEEIAITSKVELPLRHPMQRRVSEAHTTPAAESEPVGASDSSPAASASEAADEKSEPVPRCIERRRADGTLAGRYVFEGEDLAWFQWQAGGPLATPVSAEHYEHLLARGALRERTPEPKR